MWQKAKPGTGHECGDHKMVGPHLSLSSLLHSSQGRGSFVQPPSPQKTERKTRRETKLGEKPAEGQNLVAFREVCSRGKSASAGGRRVSTQFSHAGSAGPGSWERPAGSRGSAGLRGRRTPRRGSASIEHRCREISAPRRPSHPPPPDRSCFHRHLVSSAGWKRVSQRLDFPGDTYA